MSDDITIGDVVFRPVRCTRPIPHWKVCLVETGEILEGIGGDSNESRPKMKAYLEYMFNRIARRDKAEWRRQWGLSTVNA